MLTDLIAMSRRYGADADYVLAGGGNTSLKQDGVLYVKASGTQLANITQEGFVQMDINRLLDMLGKDYPSDDAGREQAALADMQRAKLPGQEHLRPSVECLLHALFAERYVLHLHPAMVNGMTCGRDGEQACRELFGDSAVWVPLTKPGYILAKSCQERFETYTRQNGHGPRLLFMQNHGVIVPGDSVADIDALMADVMQKIGERIVVRPNLAALEATPETVQVAPALRMLYRQDRPGGVVYSTNQEIRRLSANRASMQPLMLPYTPDQIVYCKGALLYIEQGQDIESAFTEFVSEHGYAPKIVVRQEDGIYALGNDAREARLAMALFLDALSITVFASAFGGPLLLTREFTEFILDWEIENYRQKVALGQGDHRRMTGKVCIVTGAAQGFGEGIARAIATEGGNVVLADRNEQGAQRLAQELCKQFGETRAISVGVDVADEESVRQMIDQTVLAFGGLDVLVSCAGILKAGGLPDMTKEWFDKVTAVNYTGYFLCAKYASAVMRIQHDYAPDYMTDIIEINSKSGLAGSKNNFAYAGSKFGGVGLTQSFALELAPSGIKVNAICPGNLLDGPLWSDPETGLFRQYLEAGKVPGAKTVEDVRRYYEAQVPLGRGCTIDDVAKAVFYLVEQQYETGQALPVTGGQVMLN